MICTALLDANVLYPAPLRDLLLQLAVSDIFKAKWTAEIHREWMDALLRKEPQRDRAALERTRHLMDSKTRDTLVSGYEALIPSVELPDPNDRHVVAAAIVGRCDVIVTQNRRDFPEAVLTTYEIEIQHPDEFLCNLLIGEQSLFCEAVRKVRQRLKNPPYTVDQYFDTLTRNCLPETVAALRPFSDLL